MKFNSWLELSYSKRQIAADSIAAIKEGVITLAREQIDKLPIIPEGGDIRE